MFVCPLDTVLELHSWPGTRGFSSVSKVLGLPVYTNFVFSVCLLAQCPGSYSGFMLELPGVLNDVTSNPSPTAACEKNKLQDRSHCPTPFPHLSGPPLTKRFYGKNRKKGERKANFLGLARGNV